MRNVSPNAPPFSSPRVAFVPLSKAARDADTLDECAWNVRVACGFREGTNATRGEEKGGALANIAHGVKGKRSQLGCLFCGMIE